MDAIRQAINLLIEGDTYTLEVMTTSLQVSAVSLAIAIVIGLPLGIALGMTRFGGKGGFLVLVNSAMGLPPVVVGLFVFMALRNEGPFGQAQLLFTPAAMVIAQVPLAVPLIAGITMAAIGALPTDIRLQARALGAGRLQQARLVAREARPSLVAACIAGFGITLSEVGAILITGGNLLIGGHNYTRTMTTAIVQETRQGRLDRAVAFAIILLFLIAMVNIVLTRAQTRR